MFKYLVFILLCFGLRLIAQESNAREIRYIETLALTFQGFEKQESESIWPHFHLSDCPVVFHFKNGHVYAFGLKRASSLWKRNLIQQYPILFCARYPISLAPLQPSFPIEKQRAFVFSLDHGGDSTFFPLLTFIHERFHIHQFQFFKKEKVSQPMVSDYQDVGQFVLMELENCLLSQFLQVGQTEEKIQALKNYLAVSHIRRQQLHEASRIWEDHQQKMEGLADYVSLKTYQVLPYLSDFKAEFTLLEMRQKKTKGLASLAEDGMKGRHYFVGAVLGWALDFCRVSNWKNKIEREPISLYVLLESALKMDESEIQKRFAEVQQNLDQKAIQTRINEQLHQEKIALNEVLQAFEQQEGVIIQMSLPSGRLSTGGRHLKSLQMGYSKALCGDSSLSISQDQAWTVRFKEIPLLFQEHNGNRTFKLNSATILHLDGREIELATIIEQKSAQLKFSSLSLQHPRCELSSKRAGQVIVKDNCVSLLFD